MKIRNLLILSVLSLFLWVNPLKSEILSVEVYWRHGACQDTCAKLLEEKLKEVKQFDAVYVSVTSYMAKIDWKKNEPFSYEAIKRAFQRVGVAIDNIRVIIKGTISPSSDRIVLVSTGDNTNFDLVSITKERPNSIYLNIDPKFKQQYLDYAKNHTILTVEGALYQPHRAPPFYLLVEKATVEEVKKSTESK